MLLKFIASAEHKYNRSFFNFKNDKKKKGSVRPFFKKKYPSIARQVEKEISKK